MSPDQANDLRKLVLHSVHSVGPTGAPPPRVVVVAGGKGGVGTTTVAVHLSAALAREGRRVVLVDANFSGPDVAHLCGIDETYGVADVLAGHRTVHEVLQRGPLGVQVLPAARGRVDANDCTPQTHERLLTQLAGMGAHADYVLVDAGSGSGRVMRRFWDAADAVLLITHPDSVAVMDAYAAVKLVCNENPLRASIVALTNCATEAVAAEEIHLRLDRAARRFLGCEIQSAGQVPFDPQVPRAAAEQHPLPLDSATCAAAAAFERLSLDLPRWFDRATSPAAEMHYHPVSSAVGG